MGVLGWRAKCKCGEEILDECVVEVAYDAATMAWVGKGRIMGLGVSVLS